MAKIKTKNFYFEDQKKRGKSEKGNTVYNINKRGTGLSFEIHIYINIMQWRHA